MVLKRDKKEDVFAGFHIERGVSDNEESLNQLEAEERRAGSVRVDDGVFAEFKLDEIIRQREEAFRKEALERKAKEAAEEGGESDSIRFASTRVTPSSSSRGAPTFRGLGLFLKPQPIERTLSNSSDEIKRHHSSRRGNGDIDGDLSIGDDGASTAATKDQSGFVNRFNPQKKKVANTSRSGTTITMTVPEEDEYYDSEDDEFVSRIDGDVEEGENGEDDDDDDSFIGRSTGKRARFSTDVITRSSTGMPIGGMITRKTSGNSSSSTQPSDYRWVSPHKADSIFSQFDIDAIVQDYEKMHRKINYATPDKRKKTFEDMDEEDEDENVLGITVRYRNLTNLWIHNFPRTHGILFKILIPLWIIIGITYFLGHYLGRFEMEGEIESNDEIMRATHNLTEFPEADLNILHELPTACFAYYLDQKIESSRPLTNNNTGSSFNYDTISNKAIANTSNGTDDEIGSLLSSNSASLVSSLSEFPGIDFSPVSPEFNADPNVTINEIKSYMKICDDIASVTLENYIDYTSMQLNAASQDSLTFNWMRCWDTTEYGPVNIYFPNEKQLNASANQSAFYFNEWMNNQTALKEEFEKKCTNDLGQEELIKCREDAFKKSVEEATGSTICSPNRAASAWFWFVFMTTVGYGNVSPVTTEGRLLVGTIGWLFVIVWAVILYIAGKVLGIIMDDMFRRCNLRKLTGNFSSVVIWFLISLAWIVFIAEQYRAFYFKTEHSGGIRYTPLGIRLDRVEDENIIAMQDAYWFSYISLLTVGLGDFSIAPESFFVFDLLTWTMSFLAGFTFLSTFLGQVADLTNSMFPDSGNQLKERLLNTNVVGKKEKEYKRENEKGIETLEKLVEIMDDDDQELLTQRVTRIRVKKNLLVHLLHQTKIELEHYEKRGERYEPLSYARVCMEENMLNEVTNNTRKEREKLEAYRDGRADTSDGTSLPLDDGNPDDIVPSKLKLRKGQKSARKKLKASWYI